MPKYTFHDEMKAVGTSGNLLDMKSSKYPDNKLMSLQHVCVVNHNKNNSLARIGFITGQQVMWIDTIKCVTQGTYYSKTYPVWFLSPRQIIVRWTNIDSGDNVEAYLYGYYQD